MNVPLFKQKRNTCGLTALRMILKYWGKEVGEQEIARGTGGIKKYGVRTIKLAEFAGKSGFKTECLSYNKKLANKESRIKKPNMRDIVGYLRKEVPVIVAVRSALLYREEPSEVGHFVVLTNYQNRKFSYNDPDDGKRHKVGAEKLVSALLANATDSSAYLLAIWSKGFYKKVD